MDTKAVENIRREPNRFLLCNGCNSILVLTASQCSICSAYGLIRDDKRVLEAVDSIILKGSQSISSDDLS